ncbi:oxidoreductase [Phlyctema vagabunda]|uniref:Oxidoreductase n=1 Tax=Phlyctema vagabunda TaxID=108571 RepID=A0ABR4PL05_9HELO
MLYGLLNLGKGFKPDKDIPDLSGKVILVTGGNIGLGKESCLQLAKHSPEHIYLAARSPEKGEAAIRDIHTAIPGAKISFLRCDLASLDSVREAARDFISKSSRLDILILNAGVMALPPSTTKEGYEMQFGTNHVGHALLTKLLLPTLLKSAEGEHDVRVVALSSIGHVFAPSSGVDFNTIKTDQKDTSTWARYGASKLANILFIRELARRYPSIKAMAVHPGVVATNLYATFEGDSLVGKANQVLKRIFYQTTESGTRGQLWAATSKDVVSGEYYTPIGVLGQGTGLSKDVKLAEKLWDWTEGELKGFEV